MDLSDVPDQIRNPNPSQKCLREILERTAYRISELTGIPDTLTNWDKGCIAVWQFLQRDIYAYAATIGRDADKAVELLKENSKPGNHEWTMSAWIHLKRAKDFYKGDLSCWMSESSEILAYATKIDIANTAATEYLNGDNNQRKQAA